MSQLQKDQLRYVLAVLKHADQAVGRIPIFIDGDCPVYSADQEAREIAAELGYDCQQIPPKTHTAKEYLARDGEIARRCDIGIAAPRTDKEEIRSGTWATVRRMRTAGKPVIFLSRGALDLLPLR
jgi:hypothetical protein